MRYALREVIVLDNTISLIHSGRTLTAMLLCDIDHHTAAAVRSRIDADVKLHRPALLVLDFSQVEFIDSSAVGLIMGRVKLMEQLGGTVKLQKLNRRCRRLLDLSGITRLLPL